jgi:hypothetical protein
MTRRPGVVVWRHERYAYGEGTELVGLYLFPDRATAREWFERERRREERQIRRQCREWEIPVPAAPVGPLGEDGEEFRYSGRGGDVVTLVREVVRAARGVRLTLENVIA